MIDATKTKAGSLLSPFGDRIGVSGDLLLVAILNTRRGEDTVC